MVEDLIFEVLATHTAREALCMPLETSCGGDAFHRVHCAGNLLAALGTVLAKLLEEILKAECAVVFCEVLLERLGACVTLETANVELVIINSEDELLMNDFAALVASLGGSVDEVLSAIGFLLMHVEGLRERHTARGTGKAVSVPLSIYRS